MNLTRAGLALAIAAPVTVAAVGQPEVADPPPGSTLISAAPDGTPGNSWSSEGNWSPDGRQVAFVSGATNLTGPATGKPRPKTIRLVVRNLSNNTNTVLRTARSPELPEYTDPVWSPDGASIAWAHNGPGRTVFLYIINATTGQADRIAAISKDMKGKYFSAPIYSNPMWSPDGTRILFDSWISTGTMRNYKHSSSVFVAQVPPNGQISLVSIPDNVRPLYSALNPVWLGNDKVAFMGRSRITTMDYQLYVAGLTASDTARRVWFAPKTTNVPELAASPDATRIVMRDSTATPKLVDLTEESYAPIRAMKRASGFAFSPDGTHISFARTTGKRNPYDQLGIYSLNTGKATIWADTRAIGLTARWSPDSTRIAWTSWGNTGNPQMVATRVR